MVARRIFIQDEEKPAAAAVSEHPHEIALITSWETGNEIIQFALASDWKDEEEIWNCQLHGYPMEREILLHDPPPPPPPMQQQHPRMMRYRFKIFTLYSVSTL